MGDESNKILGSNGIPQYKLDCLNKLYGVYEKERLRYIKYCMFIKCVMESAKVSYGIPEVNCFKIRDIILRNELVQDLIQKNVIPTNMQDLLSLCLTYKEEKLLRAALEQHIKEKRSEVKEELSVVGCTDLKYPPDVIDTIRFRVNSEMEKVVEYEDELRAAKLEFLYAMSTCLDRLRVLVQLRTTIAPPAIYHRSEELVLTSDKFHLKLDLMEKSLRVSMFGDMLPSGAYKTAYKELRQQQQDCIQHLDHLLADKAKFDELSQCHDFQELLAEYKQYKKALEKKIWIYNQIMGKNH